MATQANHSWKPSAARLLTITGFERRPRGAGPLPGPATVTAWPPKDPGDLLDYAYDISPALRGDEGDSIATLDVTITPGLAGDLTLTASSVDGQMAILWFGAGESGTTYAVTLAITTIAGREFQRTVYLPCIGLSALPPLGTELVTETGAAILDHGGNPIFIES
ncbi:phage fiber-tail adaptor protein [Acidisoma sp. 7E03]